MYCEENFTIRNKFACNTSVVELLNLLYVVMTLKCVFIVIMFHFLSLFEWLNMKKVYRIGGKSVVIHAESLKKNTVLPIIQFSQHDISIHASLVLYILWYRILSA
jgi:hypothetical protein